MTKKRNVALVLLAGTAAIMLSCGGGSQMVNVAAPTFCPTHLAQDLEVAPETGNVPPRAYYQRLTTIENTPLSVTLYACDPNDATTSDGLSWRQPPWDGAEGPFNGTLSAYSGTYPNGVITYTPSPGFVGSDSFTYLVDDGLVEGNTAEILIAVTPPPLTGQQLYFGGKDDSYRTHLWHYDGVSPIATVSGSARALSQIGLEWLNRGVVFGNQILYIAAAIGGEPELMMAYDPATRGFTLFSEMVSPNSLVEYNGLLYTGATAAATGSSYLWAYSGGPVWNPVPGTAGLFPSSLTTDNGRLYFSGDAGSGNMQVWSYNSSGGNLTAETSTGTSLWPRELTPCNGRLYFAGQAGAFVTSEYLWSLDGVSPAATVSSRAVNPGNLICFAGKVYFTARDVQNLSVGSQLWSVDSGGVLGTWTSVNTVTGFWVTFSDNFSTVLDNTLFLKGFDDISTGYIWAHNGVSSPTAVPGSAGINPFFTAVFDDRLFFSSSYTAYDQLWSYDPVSGDLDALSAIPMGLSPRGFVVHPP